MLSLRFSDQSLQELDEIWEYIAQDSPLAAESVIQNLRQLCKTLAAFPQAGRKRDDVSPGVRSLPKGNFVIFYKVLPGELLIIRILHGSRGQVDFG